MSKFVFAALLAFSSLLALAPVSAQTDYRSTTRAIGQEYQNQNGGRMISDAQLGHFMDHHCPCFAGSVQLQKQASLRPR